jgi:hypothetical protein
VSDNHPADTLLVREPAALPPPAPPAGDDPVHRPDGELTAVELFHRLGVLAGAGLFLAEGQGTPWSRGLMPAGAGLLLAVLVVVTLAFTWRVLGDWRRWSNQLVYVALAAVLTVPLCAALDPRISGSALPTALEIPLAQFLSTLDRMPGVGTAMTLLKGVVVFVLYCVTIAVLLAASGPAQRGGFAFFSVVLALVGLFFHPTAETVVGFALLAYFMRVQWERALLIPEKLRPHLRGVQVDYLRELLREGALSTGETKLYLENNPALFQELLEYGLARYESLTREVVPGERLLHDPAAETLEFGLSVLRRGVWLAVGVVYFVMPDLIPGPLDDLLVMMVCSGASLGWFTALLSSRGRVNGGRAGRRFQ